MNRCLEPSCDDARIEVLAVERYEAYAQLGKRYDRQADRYIFLGMDTRTLVTTRFGLITLRSAGV